MYDWNQQRQYWGTSSNWREGGWDPGEEQITYKNDTQTNRNQQGNRNPMEQKEGGK